MLSKKHPGTSLSPVELCPFILWHCEVTDESAEPTSVGFCRLKCSSLTRVMLLGSLAVPRIISYECFNHCRGLGIFPPLFSVKAVLVLGCWAQWWMDSRLIECDHQAASGSPDSSSPKGAPGLNCLLLNKTQRGRDSTLYCTCLVGAAESVLWSFLWPLDIQWL